jgi:mannose-6-phosphate isomerase-like protein (cupin superfamily)
MTTWETAATRPAYDLLAPDGSEIRLLVQVGGGSMVHCTLPPGQASQAVRHRTVEELWYCLAGSGQVWRQTADREEIVDVQPGVALTIPLGTSFQFKASEAESLELVIVTLPPWPGEAEAVHVAGRWS